MKFFGNTIETTSLIIKSLTLFMSWNLLTVRPLAYVVVSWNPTDGINKTFSSQYSQIIIINRKPKVLI